MVAHDRNDDHSKETSGRVALFHQTGVLHCYTLECNYDSGKSISKIPKLTGGLVKESAISSPIGIPKYTPEAWADVGKGILITVLDLDECNPCSRVPNSDCGSVDAVRAWVLGKPFSRKTSTSAGPSVTQRLPKIPRAVPPPIPRDSRPPRSSSAYFASHSPRGTTPTPTSLGASVHHSQGTSHSLKQGQSQTRPASASSHVHQSPRGARTLRPVRVQKFDPNFASKR